MIQNKRIYEKYVEKNYGKLVSYTSSKIGYEEANELVQKCLAKVWNKINRINDETHLEAYIMTTINNAFKSQLRKKTNLFVNLDEIQEIGVAPSFGEYLDVRVDVFISKMSKSLQLTKEEVKILQFMMEDIPPRDILKELGLNEKSLESIKGKKKRLRKKMQTYYATLPDEVKKYYDTRRYKKRHKPTG